MSEKKQKSVAVRCKTIVTTIEKFIEKFKPEDLLDLNPITQRPPIYLAIDNSKSIEIIETILKGVSIGLVTIVTLKYSAISLFKWESLDGGHRKRAIWGFYNGLFALSDGRKYENLTKEEKEFFLNSTLAVDIYKPMSNYMKGEVFRILNGTMHQPNHQEILNSFGDVAIANAIRETVRENLDKNHALFNLTDSGKSKWINKENKRLILEELIARIYYRYYVNGYVGAKADKELMQMYSDESLAKVKVKQLKKKVDAQLNFLKKCATVKKEVFSSKLNWKELNTLSNLYHTFNERLVEWTMFNEELFYKNFNKVFNDFQVDPDGRYAKVVKFEWEKEDKTIKDLFNAYTTCYDSTVKQQQLMTWILEHEDLKLNSSIRVLDKVRLFKEPVKQLAYANQNYCCGLDGEPAKYDELEAAHDVAYILGGSTSDASNCVMIRKKYNRMMGTKTIAEYRKELDITLKKQKKVA